MSSRSLLRVLMALMADRAWDADDDPGGAAGAGDDGDPTQHAIGDGGGHADDGEEEEEEEGGGRRCKVMLLFKNTQRGQTAVSSWAGDDISFGRSQAGWQLDA